MPRMCLESESRWYISIKLSATPTRPILDEISSIRMWKKFSLPGSAARQHVQRMLDNVTEFH